MIRKGDIVEILPAYSDLGDEIFTWIALSDEELGRVDIKPIDHPMAIKPVYSLPVEQVRLVTRGFVA